MTVEQELVPPGICIRTRVNLGESEREIFFETTVDGGTSLAEIDRYCDVMQKAADRQRARHVLPSYRRDREEEEYKRTKLKSELAQLDANLKVMDEARADKKRELEASLDKKLKDAEVAWEVKGDRRPFKAPAGVLASINADIATLADQSKKEHADTEMRRAGLRIEIEKQDRLIGKWAKIIEEHEALLREPPG